jgi:CheY-like chemotaxis protein/predicted DNA-binding protein (UPF0251 family)
MGSEWTSEALIPEVRKALRQLYITAELRKNPLCALLGLDARAGGTALRTVLLEAIEALKPAAGTPADARPWRLYETLRYLYVQQFSQEEVAAAMAISSRQLRRQERLALQLLADHLWARFKLAERQGSEARLPVEDTEACGYEQELAWLERSLPAEVADLAEFTPAVLTTVEPLARKFGVELTPFQPVDLPRVAVQPAAVRQALLMALTAAIRSAPGGKVIIGAQAGEGMVRVTVRLMCLSGTRVALAEDVRESLEMARRLVGLSGGDLQVTSAEAGAPLAICLALPVAEQMAVLGIDDNADALQLFQRYLAGTRYPFVGVSDPQQALALARELHPAIILLDIMIPGVDGWQLLSHLREHPHTRDVPIIVCSILPEEQLALTLGAAGFLRKPVQREALLESLERVTQARYAR